MRLLPLNDIASDGPLTRRRQRPAENVQPNPSAQLSCLTTDWVIVRSIPAPPISPTPRATARRIASVGSHAWHDPLMASRDGTRLLIATGGTAASDDELPQLVRTL